MLPKASRIISSKHTGMAARLLNYTNSQSTHIQAQTPQKYLFHLNKFLREWVKRNASWVYVYPRQFGSFRSF